MIYESWLELLQSLLYTVKFFKIHPELLGVIFLILRQHNIRKIVNKKLPRRLRDNMDSDIRHIQADIKRIMIHLEVPMWDAGRKNLNNPTGKRLSRYLRTISFRAHFIKSFIRRLAIKNWRFNMQILMNKTIWLAILGALVPIINEKYDLNLNAFDLATIAVAIVAGIAAIAHLDGKKIKADVKSVTTVLTADPNLTYKDLVKTVNTVHTAITEILGDLQKNDGSAAFHAAADAYTTLLSVVHDFKRPEPLPEIPEKVSA